MFFNYTYLNGCATNLLSLVCVELSRDFSNNDLCGTIPVTGSFTRLQAKRLVQKWHSFGHVKDPVEFNSEKVSILIQITQLLMEMNCSRSEKLIILGPDK